MPTRPACYCPLRHLGAGLLCLAAWAGGRPAQAQFVPLTSRVATTRDSLQRLLARDRQPDTTRVNRLSALAFLLRTSDVAQTRQASWQAYRLAQRLHYQAGLLRTTLSLGYYYRGSRQYDSALHYTRQALRLAEQQHRPNDKTWGLYNLARIYFEQGDYSGALASNVEGVALAQVLRNRKAELYQLIESGLIETALGEYGSARQHFDQALNIAQSLHDTIGMGHAYSGLGDLNRQQEHWSLAGHYYAQAAANYRRAYNATGLLPTEISLTDMTDRQGNHAAALAASRHLVRRADNSISRGQLPRAQLLLARTLLANGKPDSACQYGLASLASARHNGMRADAREAALVVAVAYARHSRWDSAYHYQVLAGRYADTLTGEATRRRVAGLQGMAARTRQQVQIRLLQQQGRLQAQQQELATLRYRQQRLLLAAVVALVLAASAGALWYYRRRGAARLLALRTRIAADLHDEVGSILTQISMQSTVLRDGHHTSGQQQAYLDQMLEASRRAARQLSDAVWSIDARHDSVASLLDRLRDHAYEVLPAAGIELIFSADAAVPTSVIPLATRQALYFIYKEALHNVVKHARAQQVWVQLRRLGGQLELEVRDDGQGIPEAVRTGGQGLRNMRMRAAAVGGSLRLLAAAPGLCLVARLPL